MMQEFNRGMRLSALAALTGDMASAANHGWLGRTHLQKAVFFLQEHLGVPFGYTFTIYQYGPYSSTLDSDLLDLLNLNVLRMSVHSGYPDYGLGENTEAFLTYFNRDPMAREYERQFTKVAQVLASKKARELELLTTISFLQRLGWAGDKLIAQVRRLKPHFSEADVKSGIDELGRVLAGLS
jgi:uncharacterized protein YwgA